MSNTETEKRLQRIEVQLKSVLYYGIHKFGRIESIPSIWLESILNQKGMGVVIENAITIARTANKKVSLTVIADIVLIHTRLALEGKTNN